MILAADIHNLSIAFHTGSGYQTRLKALAYEIESVFITHTDATYRACVTILSASGDPAYLRAVQTVLSASEWWVEKYPNNLFIAQHLLNLLGSGDPMDVHQQRTDIPLAWVKNDARLVIEANKNSSESLEIAMLYHLIILSLQQLTEKAA